MTTSENKKTTCGIVMPISSIDGCTEDHWSDVLTIITEAIEESGFEANLVSNADDVGIIQKRIIQNLYDNPIVVCDVSGKNPNVMFELGMRLAFDKPTIIIKDDKTSYSFDTSPIEHLTYPRDLRFGKIIEFKARLRDKIINTYKSSIENPEYTTFLKHFGEFKVAKLSTKEVSGSEYIIDEIKSLRSILSRMERGRIPIRERMNDKMQTSSDSPRLLELEIGKIDEEGERKLISSLLGIEGVKYIDFHRVSEAKNKIAIRMANDCDLSMINTLIESFYK